MSSNSHQEKYIIVYYILYIISDNAFWQYEYTTLYKCCMCGCSYIDSCMIYTKMLFFPHEDVLHDICVLTILYYFVYFYETLDV